MTAAAVPSPVASKPAEHWREALLSVLANSPGFADQFFARLRKKLIGEAGRIGEYGQQRYAPMFGGFGGHWGGNGGAGHLALAPDADEAEVLTWREAVFGAAVNPEAAPMPSISSQRGQVLATLPCRARSITSLAIFSTTCTK